MTEIVVIAHNIRSSHNIGSIFRTAEGFGVQKIILSGHSPYPNLQLCHQADDRLPHIQRKLTDQIHKTALGAEEIVPFEYRLDPPLDAYKSDGYRVVALEQDPRSIDLRHYRPTARRRG